MSFATRRAGGVAGLSFIATTGLLGAYLGYPVLRKAHAATTCTVTTADDAGAGSLRQCLLDSTSGTITFDPSVTDTIALSSNLPQVTLTSSLTIVGNGVDNTVIDGREAYRLFRFVGGHDVTISGVTLRNADDDNTDGAALYSKEGSLHVRECAFSDNYSYFGGPAIRTKSGGDVTITNSTFTDNRSEYAGGAVRTEDGSITVTSSTFSSNRATYLSFGNGGAIISTGGDIVVSASTFTGNQASGRGGAIAAGNYGLGVAVEVSNSTFTNNSASGSGAAIYSRHGTGSIAMNFSTVSGNTTSGGSSGALHSVGSLSVTNSIVSNASGGDVQGASVTLSHSLLGTYSGTVPASVIVGEDPLLGALADNGGPTQTMMPGAGSPVLGAANPSGAPATDQRGYTRTTNGRADMGAVERLGVPPTADPSQVPPSWHQAQGREQREAACPPGMAPSWAQWPNEGTGGWTCEYTTWWDVNKGVSGGWVTTPGFRSGRIPGL